MSSMPPLTHAALRASSSCESVLEMSTRLGTGVGVEEGVGFGVGIGVRAGAGLGAVMVAAVEREMVLGLKLLLAPRLSRSFNSAVLTNPLRRLAAWSGQCRGKGGAEKGSECDNHRSYREGVGKVGLGSHAPVEYALLAGGRRPWSGAEASS